MCGIMISTSENHCRQGLEILAHRGRDQSGITPYRFAGTTRLYVGFNRLAILDLSENANQPLVTASSIIVFNGELFNYGELGVGLLSSHRRYHPRWQNEIHIIEAMMRRFPQAFERFLDGYYGIVRINRARQHVIVSRDIIGVIPLYYQRPGPERPFAIASEKKALTKPIEVRPGETLTFDANGRLLKRRVYDPISLHMQPLQLEHLAYLLERAVHRRYLHSDKPVTVALSGGLDSSLILAALMEGGPRTPAVTAVTVVIDAKSDEARNAERLAEHYRIPHTLVVVTAEDVNRDREAILWHLEDDQRLNPIKLRGMIRNYYVAKHAPGTVILCGEGADEIGCGYPPHLIRSGLELEWRSYQSLRSMAAINLDRVNKGGLAFTKEFRTPFLDRALVLYVMGCIKGNNKAWLRQLARRYGLPSFIQEKSKYGVEEQRLNLFLANWAKSASAVQEKKAET